MDKVEMVNETLKKQNEYFRGVIAELIGKKSIDNQERLVLIDSCGFAVQGLKKSTVLDAIDNESIAKLKSDYNNMSARFSQARKRIENLVIENEELRTSAVTMEEFNALKEKAAKQLKQIEDLQHKVHDYKKRYENFKEKFEKSERLNVTVKPKKQLVAS